MRRYPLDSSSRAIHSTKAGFWRLRLALSNSPELHRSPISPRSGDRHFTDTLKGQVCAGTWTESALDSPAKLAVLSEKGRRKTREREQVVAHSSRRGIAGDVIWRRAVPGGWLGHAKSASAVCQLHHLWHGGRGGLWAVVQDDV